MGNILLIVCLAVMAGAGFWVMGRFDRFLEENYHETGAKKTAEEPLLRIALEDPAWIGSLGEALEQSSKKREESPVSLYSGDLAQIETALKSGRIELGIVEEVPEAIEIKGRGCQAMKIPGRRTRILADGLNLPVAVLRTKIPQARTAGLKNTAKALKGRNLADVAVPGREDGCFVTVLWNPEYPSGSRDAMLGMLRERALRRPGI